MARIYYQSVPFCREDVTQALEAGVDGLIVPAAHTAQAAALARVPVLEAERLRRIQLRGRADEETARRALQAGERVVLARGWEVIPVENLLAGCPNLLVEAGSLEEAKLAAGILERGVDGIVAGPDTLAQLATMVAGCRLDLGREELVCAEIIAVEPAGLGHRVCVDTLSMLHTGQGLLVGNSSAFTFLVHAETEAGDYVPARPFRVNAGAVHAYTRLPRDTTCYLEELRAGREVLIVDAQGRGTLATVGRVKIEVRPMLLISARAGEQTGTLFVQNAETIRLVSPTGEAVSVVSLKRGDQVLCRLDEAGRHFGIRVRETVREV